MDNKYYSEVKSKLRKVSNERQRLREKISKMQEYLKLKGFEEFLLESSLLTPTLAPANEKYREYRYLTESLHITSCNLTIYPVWIELECLFPSWGKNSKSVYIQSLRYYVENEKEVLIDAVSRALQISYEKVTELNDKYEILFKDVYGGRIDPDNIKIDYNRHVIIDMNDEYMKERRFTGFANRSLDSDNICLSVCDVKYLLIIPEYIKDKIEDKIHEL